MKYIKLFENSKMFYENGDIVLVYSEYNEIYNEIMEIIYANNPLKSYSVKFFNDIELESIEYFILDSDIIRKLESHEIEAIKYNL
jgi:hypothetical protein